MQSCAQVETYELEHQTNSYVQSLNIAHIIAEMSPMELNSLQQYLYEVNGNRGYGISTNVKKIGDDQLFPYITK
jgi:hypothetical protein